MAAALGTLQQVPIYGFNHLWSNAQPGKRHPVDVLRESYRRSQAFDMTTIRWCTRGAQPDHGSGCTFMHARPDTDTGRACAAKFPSAAVNKPSAQQQPQRQQLHAAVMGVDAAVDPAVGKPQPDARDDDDDNNDDDATWMARAVRCTMLPSRAVAPQFTFAADVSQRAVLSHLAQLAGLSHNCVLVQFALLFRSPAVLSSARHIYDTTWAPFTDVTRRARTPPPVFFAVLLAATEKVEHLPSWVDKGAREVWAAQGDCDAGHHRKHCLIHNRSGALCYREEEHGEVAHWCLMCGARDHCLGAESFAHDAAGDCPVFCLLRDQVRIFAQCFAAADVPAEHLLVALLTGVATGRPDAAAAAGSGSTVGAPPAAASEQQPAPQQLCRASRSLATLSSAAGDASASRGAPEAANVVDGLPKQDDGKFPLDGDKSIASTPAATDASPVPQPSRDLVWYKRKYAELAFEHDCARAPDRDQVKEVKFHASLRYFPYDITPTTPWVVMWCQDVCCAMGATRDPARTAHRGFCWGDPEGYASGSSGEPLEIVVKVYADRRTDDEKKQQPASKSWAAEVRGLKLAAPELYVWSMAGFTSKNEHLPGVFGPPSFVVATKRRARSLRGELLDQTMVQSDESGDPARVNLKIIESLLLRMQRLLLPSPPPPSDDAVMSPAAAAGDAQQQRLTCHGDIKPDNVCVDQRHQQLQVDFIDFEFSRFSRVVFTDAMRFSAPSLSSTTTIRGATDAWSSPAQFATRVPSAASDMWSLALLVYEVLHNRRRDVKTDGSDLPLFFLDELDPDAVQRSDDVKRLNLFPRSGRDALRRKTPDHTSILNMFIDDIPVAELDRRMAAMDALRPQRCDAFAWALMRPMFSVALGEDSSDLDALDGCLSGAVAAVQEKLAQQQHDLAAVKTTVHNEQVALKLTGVQQQPALTAAAAAAASSSAVTTPAWLAALMAQHGIQLEDASIQRLVDKRVDEQIFRALEKDDLAELGIEDFAAKKRVMLLVKAAQGK